MKFFLILILISAVGFAQESGAENTSSTEMIDTHKPENDKADKVITNRRFRASNGSLSKLSMNAGLNYNGGSISKPLAADRPNISNAGDTTSISGLNGTVNASYRLNKLNRINLGTGLQMLAPFNDDIDTNDQRAQQEFDENQGELDVSNPYFSFTHMNRFYDIQTILSAGMTQYTASNLTDVGYNNSLDLSVNTMYDFGGSKFSLGALVLYNRYFFDKDDEIYKPYQNLTVWGFLPQAEYIINDTFNLRTIVRSNWYQNTRVDTNDFDQRPVTQSVGLGISLDRNIFLYPNLQFVYRDLKAENTNIGLSANINMF